MIGNQPDRQALVCLVCLVFLVNRTLRINQMNQTNQTQRRETYEMNIEDREIPERIMRTEEDLLRLESERQQRSASRILKNGLDELKIKNRRGKKQKQKYLNLLESNKQKYNENTDYPFEEYFKFLKVILSAFVGYSLIKIEKICLF